MTSISYWFYFTGRCIYKYKRTTVSWSVYRFATGWTVRGSNAGGGEILRNRPERPWGTPSVLYNGYWVSLLGEVGGKSAGAWRYPPTTIYHRDYRNGRAIPLFPFWAFTGFPRLNFLILIINFSYCFLQEPGKRSRCSDQVADWRLNDFDSTPDSVQTASEAQRVSCRMGTGGSFPGIRRPRHEFSHFNPIG